MTANNGRRRVVVTGLGTLNPVGNDVASTWQSLMAGRSGIARISAFDPAAYDCQIAGEIKGFNRDGLHRAQRSAAHGSLYAACCCRGRAGAARFRPADYS